MPDQQIFCSEHSLSLNEPLFATAPRIESWILLEYPGHFSAKAFEESSLPQEVKNHLSAVLDATPHSRLLMIKKDYEAEHSGFDLMLVTSHPSLQRMARYRFSDYAELLTLDLHSFFSNPPAASEADSAAFFLVCTNGKRDLCCARYGLPFYTEMNRIAGQVVWQSSHMSGHRFAANLILLPFGIYFGRLRADEAERFVELSRAGQIDLQHYRGRTCYTEPQQAAEYFVRQHTGNTVIDDLLLTSSAEAGDDRWLMQFESRSGDTYLVNIRSELSEYNVIESCASPHKAKPQPLYYLEAVSKV